MKKIDVWLIADSFVCEPSLGGALIGETLHLDMSQYNIIEELTQDELNKMSEEFYRENGYWPDT